MTARKPIEIAAAVERIAVRAKAAFIDREDTIDALAAAIASGEHAIIIGPPGTAKSAIVRYFAAAMGRVFFRRVLNPDTARDDLVGPIDPRAIAQGKWDRCWAGLATCDFALLDEVGKASDQVLNMMLDAMEERRVTSGDIDMPIPLHTAIGATNETISDVEAIWDRFTIRLLVRNIDNAANFTRMLTSDINDPDPDPITHEELVLLRDTTAQMAQNPPRPVIEKMVELWNGYGAVSSSRISDRRWRRILRVAAGNALMCGYEQIRVTDLRVSRWMLWDDIDEHDDIRQWIAETVVDDGNQLLDATALLEELEQEVKRIKSGNTPLEDLGNLYYKVSMLMRVLEGNESAEWSALRTRAQILSRTLAKSK